MTLGLISKPRSTPYNPAQPVNTKPIHTTPKQKLGHAIQAMALQNERYDVASLPATCLGELGSYEAACRQAELKLNMLSHKEHYGHYEYKFHVMRTGPVTKRQLKLAIARYLGHTDAICCCGLTIHSVAADAITLTYLDDKMN